MTHDRQHAQTDADGHGQREAREARRAERRQRLRAKLEEHGLGDIDVLLGVDLQTWGLGAFEQSDTRADMQTQIDAMARTIQALSERVIVLERLAVHDEKRLAEEIDALRNPRSPPAP